MSASVSILRWVLRLAFLASLILGFVLWTGHGYAYLQSHMWLGFIITFDLLFLATIGFLLRMSPGLPLLVVIWAILLPVIGIAQLRLMPGPNHWIIRVIHLLLGLGAIGVGEALAGRALRTRAPGLLR